jgi:dTDP-4-dehydrorhamnose reductase
MLTKILLLGSSGMLGSYISRNLEIDGVELIPASRESIDDFDFNKPDKVITFIKSVKPAIIINAVACISLDFCEKNPALSRQVNSITPSIISQYCQNNKIYFIHISTDHFFSDNKDKKHSEDSMVSIVNQYAASKFEAENRILENKEALILRTSIIGRTSKKKSFLDWAINQIESRQNINLFDDSYSSFMHCKQFVSLLKILILKQASGLYNVASSDVFSKADCVIKLASLMNIKITYQLTSVNNLKIKRANSCGLDTKKIINEYKIVCPSFDEVVNCSFNELEQSKD